MATVASNRRIPPFLCCQVLKRYHPKNRKLIIADCTTGWVCDYCGQIGHKKDECTVTQDVESCFSGDDQVESEREEDDVETESKDQNEERPNSEVESKDTDGKDKKKGKSNVSGTTGPIDRFVRAAKEQSALTPVKSRDRSLSKQRTPPSPNGGKEKKKKKSGKT